MFKKTQLLMFFIGLLASQLGWGATICATTSQGLQNALDIARNNGEDDVIRVAAGTYFGPGVSSFGSYTFFSSEEYDLTITGGFFEFFGNPCGISSSNPLDTVIDGNNAMRTMYLALEPFSNLTITNLSVANGNASSGAGLTISRGVDNTGEVLIDRVGFFGNYSSNSTAIYIDDGGVTRIRNSLFYGNFHGANDAIVEVRNRSQGIYFVNNTLVDNLVIGGGSDGGSGLKLFASEGAGAFVTNNLFWNNQTASDVFLAGNSTANRYLLNNNITLFDVGNLFDVINGNFSAEPSFQAGVMNYLPALNSGEINRGISPPVFLPIPTPFNLDWHYGPFDFEGNPRVEHGQVDVGAFEAKETLPLFANGFEIIL